MKMFLELTDKDLTSNAGLFLVGPYLRNEEFRRGIRSASRVKKKSGVISDVDIICSWIALLTLGKSDYESIEEFRNDEFFKNAIGVKKVPSSETLRQRIEDISPEVDNILREFNVAIIAGAFQEAKKHGKKDRHYAESVTIDNKMYTVVDSDVSVLDNSDSQKEGVEWTYKKCDGYAPMFSYIGASGYMLDCELREGSMHSNAPGTLDYFDEAIAMGRQTTDLPLLCVLDSGNDDKSVVDLFEERQAFYVIKRNLRQEPVQQWLEHAKATQQFRREGRDGSTVYYASDAREIQVDERKKTIRIVVVAREHFFDKNKQLLLIPEISVDTYWTNLSCSEQLVESVYHMHGTMEQYHAELKSDMGVERLPSGKFCANSIHLQCAMIAFNLLRRFGSNLLKTGEVPGKRGRRLRLRTVLQSVMYMAGWIVEHGGQMFVRICQRHAWSSAFYSSA